MKKGLLILAIFILSIVLIACEPAVNSPVVISKVYTSAARQANNVIELYNPSEEAVDLSTHALQFYTNGSKEVSVVIQLSGVIEAESYYVVGSTNHNMQTVKDLFDFVYETGSLPYNGNDYIELAVSGKASDVVGYFGFDINYSMNTTMIRAGLKEDYQPDNTFDTFNYIYYLPDVFEFLKNDDHEIKTLEQLYEGPRLEDRYLDMAFADPENNQVGLGGAVVTTNTGVADGDTAYFSAKDGFPGGSMRYYYINTPEVNGPNVNAEPWGYVASKYNKQYLLNDPQTKTIHVQSIPGVNLTEGFGRSLGLVWVNGHLSQFLIVREGLAEDVSVTYTTPDLGLSYKKVPYLTFLRYAEFVAKENGWGVKGFPNNPEGEKSPDWNYQSNTLATTNPVWEPHLEIPWDE